MAEKNIDAFAARLSDANLGRRSLRPSCGMPHCSHRQTADACAEVQKKYNTATELRDNIDILCNGPAYPIFLKKLVPVFMKLLEGPPVFMSTYMEHVSYALTLALTML